MSQIYVLHPVTPQDRIVDRIRDDLQQGAVMLYPTDTVPAIGCDLQSPQAIKRVRHIKRLSNDKPLTFLCSSLSNIADYAIVSDPAYRLMKHLIPGPYTFLLPSTKLVPRLVMDPKRKTVGIRVPDNAICQAIVQALDHPVISTSAHLPERGEAPRWDEMDPHSYHSYAELMDRFASLVDIAIDNHRAPGDRVSTIIDLTGPEPEMLREGLGWERAAEWL